MLSETGLKIPYLASHWVPAIVRPKCPNKQFQMPDFKWVWNRLRITLLTNIPQLDFFQKQFQTHFLQIFFIFCKIYAQGMEDYPFGYLEPIENGCGCSKYLFIWVLGQKRELRQVPIGCLL
jgi:hypothetical protein